MTVAGVLLAAGRSERFGTDDKLLAKYRGAPLVSQAARALKEISPDFLIVVTDSDSVAAALPGFTVVPSGRSGVSGLADSLRAGISAANELGAARALVLLGDMPLVFADLLRDVVDRSSDTVASATTDGIRRMPPACFPKVQFPKLMSLTGDQGAQKFLADLPDDRLVNVAEDMLQDVDTIADLDRLAMQLDTEGRSRVQRNS